MASNKHVDLRKMVKKRELISENLVKTLKSLIYHPKGKEGWYLTMIERIKTTIELYFTVNPIRIYEIWIASKVSRLNALT